MNEVWLVVTGSYEDETPFAHATSEELAKEIAAKYNVHRGWSEDHRDSARVYWENPYKLYNTIEDFIGDDR